MSNVSLSEQLSGLRCDQRHEHGQSRGNDLKKAESCTYVLTDVIHPSWSKHVRQQVKYIAACDTLQQVSETGCLVTSVRRAESDCCGKPRAVCCHSDTGLAEPKVRLQPKLGLSLSKP